MLLWGAGVQAQWKEIGSFGGEYISCVHFLDLPGPPRVGFVGTESSLYKTTDGGKSWAKSWGGRDQALYHVTGITFRDSLTGWFTMFGGTDACYRTTDGGESWKLVYSRSYGAESVYFLPSSNLLFLSLAFGDVPTTLVSGDLGETWKPVLDTVIFGISFSTPTIGISGSGIENSSVLWGLERTEDAGLSWKFIPLDFKSKQICGTSQVLSITDSPTMFFASGCQTTIWRSDDYGLTWRMIYDFGPDYDTVTFARVAPYCTGYIKGNLNRLTIQTDTGMFISMDGGVSWQFDAGPEYIPGFSNDNFWSGKGYTFAGRTYQTEPGGVLYGGGLWVEEWPMASVQRTMSEDCFTVRLLSPRRVETTSTQATLLIHSCNMPSVVYLEVFDQLGKAVSRVQSEQLDDANQNRLAFDLPKAAGAYWIRAFDGQNTATTSFIVE